MIEFLREQCGALSEYITTTVIPLDLLDILVVALAIYWALMLIRGTRAVQMVTGLIVLMIVRLIADWINLETVAMILENFFGWAVVILVVIFQHDIRRALTRMGRPLFNSVPGQAQSEILEEVVRAAQRLSQNGVGALVVLARENRLEDQVEGGVPVEVRIVGARSEVRRRGEVVTESIDVSGLEKNEEREVRISITRPNVWLAEERPLKATIRIKPAKPGGKR